MPRSADWLLVGGVAIAVVAGFVCAFHDAIGGGTLAVLFLAIAAFLLAATALTLRHRTREAQEAEAVSRRLLDAACDAVVVVTPDRIIADVSVRSAALFGYPQAELAGQPLSTIVLDWSPSPADWPTAVRGRSNGNAIAEFTGRTRDGTTLALEIGVGPVKHPPGAMALLICDVTGARRVREDLRAKEAHLRLVLEQMPAILWTTDGRLHITSTVGAGLAALNLKPAELVGMSMSETLGRSDPGCSQLSAHNRALVGESLSHEMRWKGRTFQVRVEPLRNPERRITGTIGIVLDITDQKQTMAELKARVRQQAAIAALGQSALRGAELDALLKESVRAIRDTLDVELAEFLEVSADGRVLRSRAGSGWRNMERGPLTIGGDSLAGHAMLTGEPTLVEDVNAEQRFGGDPLVRVHGVVSSLNVLVQGRQGPVGVLGAHATRRRPFTTDDSNFLQSAAHVIGAALDRAQAEATHNRLVALLEATTDGVAIAGTDHHLLYVNRAGRAMMGIHESAELARLRLDDFYPGELRGRFINDIVPAALRKGSWSGEIGLRSRTGEEATVSQVVLAHRAPDGQVEFLSIVARDLSERLRLEEQLRQAQKMEAVGRLAGGIAHDFNNLLCIITGYSEMALHQMGIGAPLHTFLTEINKAGNRAATLTRQLLAFSRKSLLAPKVLDLNALFTDAGTMLRRLIGEDIELITTLEADLPSVKADPNQLEQVLMNLVVNARDAMPQGGRLEIRTGQARLTEGDLRDQPEVLPGRFVYFAVVDTGCGMDEATRARIFEPFFTTKGVGKGTGLGLAMVYGIVRQSGGHINVKSAPGQGTAFRVWLPCAELAMVELPRTGPALDMPAGTETVLVAEDEEGVRALVLQVLRRSGYTVLEASDGEEALELGTRHPGPIHMLLTDVVMPRLSGGRLARRLLRARPETCVLFMSGFADSTLVRHEVVSGEIDCLLKPFTPEDLARKVRETLDGATAGRPGAHSAN
jgi:PAS domain S-box-containing protein